MTLAEPLAVDADNAAKLFDVSLRTWRAWTSSGRNPAPLRIAGSVIRWRVDDLAEWARLGFPSRAEFEQRQAAGGGR